MRMHRKAGNLLLGEGEGSGRLAREGGSRLTLNFHRKSLKKERKVVLKPETKTATQKKKEN